MKTVFYNVNVSTRLTSADDPTAVSVSISVVPELARAQITTLMSIAEAREFALKIERAADEAESKLPQ
jgi:hypothetical protein